MCPKVFLDIDFTCVVCMYSFSITYTKTERNYGSLNENYSRRLEYLKNWFLAHGTILVGLGGAESMLGVGAHPNSS